MNQINPTPFLDLAHAHGSIGRMRVGFPYYRTLAAFSSCPWAVCVRPLFHRGSGAMLLMLSPLLPAFGQVFFEALL